MDPLVRLTGVAKRFPNGTLAVDHVDLAIEAGSFVAYSAGPLLADLTLVKDVAGGHDGVLADAGIAVLKL